MFRHRHELTLTDALADPVVQAVMAADGVDPRKLEKCFDEIARKLAGAKLSDKKAALVISRRGLFVQSAG